MTRLLLLLNKRLSAALRHISTACTRRINYLPSAGDVLNSPWSATQLRGARFTGSDVKPGNVIERKGKIYEVITAEHSSQGRGGAIVKVELRDVGTGNKVSERLRTDEALEKIFVTEKTLTYLYTDDETGDIVLMEPDTYNQIEVRKDLFGDSTVYLQDDMEITVQLYDDVALSVSIPHRVTCTVTEADEALKGSKSTPNKKVLLDNGLTVQAPAHVQVGDKIVIRTTDNTYVSRG